AGILRTTLHLFASTSTISLDLLHATKMDEPSTEGCAHVGEQVTSLGLGGSMPCTFMSMPCIPFIECTSGAPVMPISLPFVSRKWRETLNVPVSISTSMSFIMQAE